MLLYVLLHNLQYYQNIGRLGKLKHQLYSSVVIVLC